MKKLLIILSMFVFMLSTHAFAEEIAGSISNGFLKVDFSESGRFVAKTSDGKLLMSETQLEDKLTSYTTIRVDDDHYIFEGVPSPCPTDNTCDANYLIPAKNISVQQKVSLVYNTYTKKNDTVEIKYTVKNTGSISRKVGTRILLDTNIQDNEVAPFKIPFAGIVTKETQLSGNDVPPYWQVFNDLDELSDPDKAGLFVQGTLDAGGTTKKPDIFQLVSFPKIFNQPWSYTVSDEEIEDDNAVALYWNEEMLAAGKSREYVTYYGLGEFESVSRVKPIALSITGQNEANAGDSFIVSAYFQNIEGIEVKNVNAVLQLPEGFSSTNPVSEDLGNFTVGETKMHSWEVKIPSTAGTTDYTYGIQVAAEIGAPVSLNKTISVKGITQDITSDWYKTITNANKVDENKFILDPTSNASYWTLWDTVFDISSSGNDKYLFTSSFNIPINTTGLVLSNLSGGNFVIDDKLRVYVNGFMVREIDTTDSKQPPVNSIVIDKKYLMPGEKNDILMVLENVKPVKMKLSRMKIQASLDPDYDPSQVIDFNGFIIQYNNADLSNSKVIKYPNNMIIDSCEIVPGGSVETDISGEIEYANFNAKISGNIYKYNGWHRLEKLFSSNSNSNISFEYMGSKAYAQLRDVKFEQIELDLFNIKDSVSSLDADINKDQSVSLVAQAEFDFIGEKEVCDLYIQVLQNDLKIDSKGRLDVSELINVSRNYDGYSKKESLNISGGFSIDLFTRGLSGYDLKISTYDDGAKIRIKIPEFAEMSFTSLTIDPTTITAKNLQFSFTEDCIFENLRPGNAPPVKIEFGDLGLNRDATGLSDLINKCKLTVTLNDKIEIFKGSKMYLKLGSTFEGMVTEDGDKYKFGIAFKGGIILPDEKATVVDLNFSINSAGDFAFGTSVELANGLKIKELNLSPEVGKKSKIGFELINAVYENYEKKSPKKFRFYFENVGTNLDIKDAGNIRFFINQFAITEEGKLDDVEATVDGEIEFLNGNLILSTKVDGDKEGKIHLSYSETEKWKFAAEKIQVNFPNIGDDGGYKAVTDLKMSTLNGLESFSFTSKKVLNVLDGFITINGLTLSVNKAGDIYSLTLGAFQSTDPSESSGITCNIQKVLPQLTSNPQITVSNFKLTVNNLKDPKVEISCDQIEYHGKLELKMGITFSAEGLSATLNKTEKSITLLVPTITLPQIGGLKFYSDDNCQNPVDGLTVGVESFKVTYSDSGKWDVSIGKAYLPGSCVYNLAEANVCKIVLKELSMGKDEDGKFEFNIKRATATVASGFTTELSDVTISDTVSIGGGSITIPDMTIGGIGVNNFKVTFGVEETKDGKKPFFGGSCGVTIPGLASIDGSLTVQRYSENFFGTIKGASFELTLGKAIPLGPTSLALKMIRGSLTRGELPANFPQEFKFMFETGNDIKVVSMGLGLVDTSSGGKVLTAGADVWIEITDWGFALSANATVFEGFIQAEAGAAYANEIFAAYAKVRVLCVEGKVIFYVYKYDGETAISGEGSVKVRLDEGRILNKKIFRWRIKIPKHDVWFEGISAKFGRFTNGKTGFQGRVNFPILGGLSAFVGDGGLKFFTNYDIYIPSPTVKTAARKAPILASVAPMGYLFADTLTSTASDAPKFDRILEAGVYKGASVEFENKSSIERIVLSASADSGIPNITITYTDLDGITKTITLDDANIEYDVKEVKEEDEFEKETGKIGISVLLAIKNPGKGTWKIEARNDEEVTLSLITKLNEPTLKINSVVENKDTKKLTVEGEILDSNKSEHVNLIFKGAAKDPKPGDPNTIVPSERIVASSNSKLITDGVVPISISSGKFTVVIDTSIMKSGTYSLIAELERKVMCRVDGDIFNENGKSDDPIVITPDPSIEEEYDAYTREEYKLGEKVVVYEFDNSQMRKVTNLKANIASYGADSFETGDVYNTFIKKLILRGSDEKLNYIYNKLPKSFLSDVTNTKNDKFKIAAEALNKYIINDNNFYNASIFKPTDTQVTREAIKRLIAKKNAGTITPEENQRLNRLLLNAYYPGDFAVNREYSLNVSFNNVTKTADGYLMFAECFVDGVKVGTRKVNLGTLTETTIRGYTEYTKVAEDGSLTLRPMDMSVYIIPYRFEDRTKGFVYDYGNNLGFGDAIKNNIIFGPESDRVNVSLGRTTDNYIINDVTIKIPDEGFKVPVEESAEATLSIIANTGGTVTAEVESVPCRDITVAEAVYKEENVTVVIDEEKINVVNGTTEFKLRIVSNIKASDVVPDRTEEVKIRISNSNNPNDFKIVTIPFKFEVSKLLIDNVYPEIINGMTGGIIDIYGKKLLKGTQICLGTKELVIIPAESGVNRIAVKVPEDISQGQYDLIVKGVGTSNTVIWKNKITVAAPKYDWVSIRDKGKIQRGTSGKFYFRLKSDSGYLGKAGLNVKSAPTGWTVVLNKATVDMGESVEVSITVPAGETVGDKEIIIEGNDSKDSSYLDIGKLVVTVVDTPLEPAISSISKNKGYVGDEISTYGEGFINSSAAEIVSKAGNVSVMTIKSTDTNLIKAQIPDGAVTGNLRINNSGTYSNSLPITVIPSGMVISDTKFIDIGMVPGESRTINVPNSGNPISVASGASLIAKVDSSTGDIKISVPTNTESGTYDLFINVKYPNATVQTKVTVYVVKEGVTSEDLSRQVILKGRNLSMKVRGNNVTALSISKLELNGTALGIAPVKVADGWLIDMGMVNNGSVLKYQFDYTAYGNPYTTPVYEYVVEYANQNNDSDIYEATLFENASGDIVLRVIPETLFDPAKMVVTYKLDNGVNTTVNMTKVGQNWEASLGKLSDDTFVSGSFVYGTGTEEIASPKFLLHYDVQYASDVEIPWNAVRIGDGSVAVKIPDTGIIFKGKPVTPDSINVEVKLSTGETIKVPMTNTGSEYTGNLGNISSGTDITPSFTIVVNGKPYKNTQDTARFADTGYEDCKNGLIAQYFDNQDLSGVKLKITDPEINFDWRTAVPAGGMVQNSTYSMRWSGQVQSKYSEEYTFRTTLQNGTVRVCVNGVEIMDGYGSQSGKVTLMAGDMTDIVVEYSSAQKGGIKLEWESSSQPREVVPQHRLFAVEVSIPADDDDDDDIPNGMLKVQYTNEDNQLTTNHLKPDIKIINTSTASIPFSDIKVKYWFTDETKGIQTVGLYWASREQQNTVLKVVKLDSETGEYCLEIGFKGSNAELKPGEFVEIKATVNNVDWMTYDQSNDYSFRKISYYNYEDSDKITAYTRDDLAWGVEPGNTLPYKGKLDVLAYNENRNASTNMMNLSFAVVNRDSADVAPKNIKIRYWFTNETGKAMNTNSWYSSLGWSALNVKPVLSGTTRRSYIEFTFTDAAPMVKQGDYFTVKAGINSIDWTNFSQTNDYSFDAMSTLFRENLKVTAYIDDELVWGVEP